MKKITDSLLKKIVRQSLNESYGLLNEETDPKCPKGGFCLGSLLNAKNLAKTFKIDSGDETVNKLKDFCSNNKMGEGNEDTASRVVDDLQTELSSTWYVNEDRVKSLTNSLQNFSTWCLTTQMATEKGYDTADEFWNTVGITSRGVEDRWKNVIQPITELFKKSIKITETFQIKYKTETDAKQAEIEANFVKSGWATKDEWKAAGWKSKPIEYTIGGGGVNQVSFEGYECISNHPALIKTPVKNFPNGVGYKLSTNNLTIDKFIFGVQKQGTGDTAIDQGVIMKDDGSGIPFNFNCPSKYLDYSLSTTAWDYNAVIEDAGKIALTTDPAREERFTNESYRHKGFRHNLLTEIELKYVKGKLQTGVEVGNIMSKLGLPAEKNPTFGTQVLAAVINHQKTEGAKLTPPLRTDGVVDDATYASIMAIQPPPFELSAAKKSKGDDVTLVQKQLGTKVGIFDLETEAKVKEFQETNKDRLPDTIIPGVVDQATFDLIKKLKDPNSKKVYSGKKHNYIVGNWIKVTPETTDEQLSGNDGFFKITKVTDYTVVIDAAFLASGTTGGSTQRVLFGEAAKEGTQEVIKRDRNNDNNNNDNNNNNNKGTRSNTNNSNTNIVDPEKQKQRDARTKEFCDTLRQVKQYINDKKGGDLTISCDRTQKTLNQIMMALTGGTLVAPVVPVSSQGGNVTVY